MYRAVNPILRGFYPDPSICRVDEDYYMVTSSFSYFPGVPIFHSRDLRNWEQIGHVLSRASQIPLNCRHLSGGIYAPTLRYHQGVFYMITTNVDGIGDFVCTATDPTGPWSEMHRIEGAPGIDPSLFFDDDGACYMCGNVGMEDGTWIWISRFDPEHFCLTGVRVTVWNGALRHAHAPEAPHLYKKDGWYYLLIAEGGTEFYHAVTIARSRDIFGPYEGYRGNPILTHRHLGKGYPISNTGHADLVQTQNGSWYMVLLASRPYGGYHLNMGRETFLAPVDWSEDWPVVCPGTGHVEFTCPVDLPPCPCPEAPDPDRFDSMCWNRLGSPQDYDPVHVQPDSVQIRCIRTPLIPDGNPDPVAERNPLGFYGRRQQHICFEARVRAVLPDEPGVSCGLVLLQNGFASLRVEMLNTDAGIMIRAVQAWHDVERWRDEGPYREVVLAECPGSNHEELIIRADGQDIALSVADMELAHADGGFLGSESCGGFVGAYIGMYASGNGTDRNCEARFEAFEYRGLPDDTHA